LKRTDQLKWRDADLRDVPAITAVINAAFRRAESFFVDSERIDEAKVTELLRTGKFLVAQDGSTVIGCVYVELKGDRAYIGLLSVDPERQKTGLGSKLMDGAEEYCRNSRAQFVDLQIVNIRPELPRFYRRRGYVENGTAPFPAEIATKIPCHFVKMTKQFG
jgi:predicted N-acetyltransferase YhbS